MRRILGSSILIIMALGVGINASYAADITVQDITNKMQENISGMEDMKAEITTTTYMGTEMGTMTQMMKYYFKKPDKVKIEIISPVRQTMLIIGDNMVIQAADGSVSTMNIKQMMGGAGANQQNFGTDMTKMFESYDTTINDTLSDKANKKYMLKLTPKKTFQTVSQENVGMPEKTEITVDYDKGIIIKNRIYSKDNKLMAEMETKKTRKIKVQADSSKQPGQKKEKEIWMPEVMESTVFLSTGQAVKSGIKIENLQINEGIPDKEFEFK